MRKKVSRRSHRRSSVRRVSRHAGGENYLVVVRGWMLVVAFALMLGMGVIVGNYVNTQLELGGGTVAGASVEVR